MTNETKTDRQLIEIYPADAHPIVGFLVGGSIVDCNADLALGAAEAISQAIEQGQPNCGHDGIRYMWHIDEME